MSMVIRFSRKSEKEIEILFEEKGGQKLLIYEFLTKDNCSEAFAKLKYLKSNKQGI